MDEFTRRSVLGTLAAVGVVGSAGTAGATGNETNASIDPTSGSTEDVSSAEMPVERLIGVEVIEHDSGARRLFDDPTELRETELEGGRYTVVTVTESGGRVTERSRTVSAQDGFQVAQNDGGTDPRVAVITNPQNDVVPPGGNPTVKVGAVERSEGTDVGVAADTDLEVDLIGPDTFEPIESRTVTTNENGAASVEFDHFAGDDEVAVGGYRARVTVADSDSDTTATDFFSVGDFTGIPFHWTGMTPGEATTIGVYAGEGVTPVSGVTREVTVRGPDDDEESFDVEIGEGGVGLLEYTPETAGEYRFDAGDTGFESIGAAELKALVPYFSVRDQYVDGGDPTVEWGGHIVSDGSPEANVDIVVSVSEDNSGSLRDEYETTTNEFGQFTVEIDKPNEPIDFSIDLETADGREIFLFGDRLFFDELPVESPDEPDVDLDVDFDEFRLAPEDTATITATLDDEDGPVSDTAITFLVSETFRNVPVAVREAETADDGTASIEYTLPESVPDGERLYVDVVAEHDGELVSASTSVSVEQYEIDIPTFGLERGENAIDATVVDGNTDEPVEGIDLTVFGQRDNVRTETFDTNHDQTDADGMASVPLTVPEDARHDVMVNEVTPYRETNSSSGSLAPSFDLTVDIAADAVEPGGTLTVSYDAETTEAVSAVVAFPRREGANTTVLAQDEEATIAVPDYLDPGSFEDLRLLVITESGDVVEERASVSVAAELTASIVASSTEVEVDETVTLEDTSTPAEGVPIETREWDLTGDGTTDETGDTVTTSYDEPGTYDVELTVTDAAGDTDTAVESIDVDDVDDPEEPEGPVADYANDEGVVDGGGVQDAFADWQVGEIESGTLQDVFAAWQAGSPVV